MDIITRLLIILMILFISSCHSGKKNAETSVDSLDIIDDINTITDVKQDIYYLLPTPGEVLEVIKITNMDFRPELLNSPQNIDKYTTQNQQFSNLGIYLTDMVYCSFFYRKQEFINYLDVVEKLSKEINFSSNLRQRLSEALKDEPMSVDSIYSLSNKYFYEIIDDLESKYQNKRIAIISAGMYIEALYLTTSLIDTYSQDDLLVKKLAELKFAFNNLLFYAESFKDDEDVNMVFEHLQTIDDMFKNNTEYFGNSGDSTSKQEERLNLTEEDFLNIKNKAQEIRNQFIQ